LALAASILSVGAASAQQPGLLIFGGPLPQAELTAPQVNTISGAIASRLEQARTLTAARNWEEVIDIYRELATDDTDRIVPLDDDRYVNLRTYCNLQLARLPVEGLAAYRRRADPLAERWYRDGLAARDELLLGRVVSQLFCSSWGDDALIAVGELALERSDFDAARRAWEQTSPLVRDPAGRTMWLALRDINLDAHWPEVERLWAARANPPDWLAYPDTGFNLADIRARLVLTSIRAGEFERAKLELDAFCHWHPDAVGQLGGQQGPYVPALEKLLSSAREWISSPPQSDWPTFAGSQTRSSSVSTVAAILIPVWERPIAIEPPIARRLGRLVRGEPGNIGPIEDPPSAAPRESGRPLSCFPVVADNLVLFADAAGIHAAHLATGKPAIAADGLIYRNEATLQEQQIPSLRNFGIRGIAGSGVSHGVPRLTLTVVDRIAYGRVGAPVTSRSDATTTAADDRIIGLDLRREGLLTLRLRPDDTAWSFDGTPVSDGRRIFVAMRHDGVTPGAYVACFDATTGSQLWRTSIGSADTPAAGRGEEITHHLLTLVGDRIYFNTSLGLVAALDAANGQICWLAKYPRLTGRPFTLGDYPLHFDRDPSPGLYHDGLVVVAPADSPDIFALDAESGKTIWTNTELPDALHLLGAVGQNLIVSGNRLSVLLSV
jgi:hypothetical protein